MSIQKYLVKRNMGSWGPVATSIVLVPVARESWVQKTRKFFQNTANEC